MLVSKNIYERIRNSFIAEWEKMIIQGTGDIKPTGIVGSPGGDMDMEILKDKNLKLFEETDRQSDQLNCGGGGDYAGHIYDLRRILFQRDKNQNQDGRNPC